MNSVLEALPLQAQDVPAAAPKYTVERYAPDCRAEWDGFIAAGKNATFMFRRDYMDYHADRFEDHSLVLRKDGQIAALLPANLRPDAVLVSHQGLTYGGFVLRRDATLAGCRLIGRTATLCREGRAIADHTTPTHAVWDGRWSLSGPHDPALHLGALGAEGLRHCPGWRATGLHRAVLAATPAVWDGPRLVAAPLAGLSAGWQAICPPVGTAFNKVH